ncbi:MAG: DUF4279 domain-containing protein [Planctomycetota bacterium]|jgi:hypothetical protein
MPRVPPHNRAYQAAHAALRFRGDRLDPSDVTKLLRLPPDTAHRKGDLRLSRTKKGKVVECAPYSAGHWGMSSERWVDSPKLEKHVEWVLSQVEDKLEDVAHILSEGATGDVFCYSAGRTATPPSLPESLRTRVAALGLEIGIDHYEVGEDDERQGHPTPG